MILRSDMRGLVRFDVQVSGVEFVGISRLSAVKATPYTT